MVAAFLLTLWRYSLGISDRVRRNSCEKWLREETSSSREIRDRERSLSARRYLLSSILRDVM